MRRYKFDLIIINADIGQRFITSYIESYLYDDIHMIVHIRKKRKKEKK